MHWQCDWLTLCFAIHRAGSGYSDAQRIFNPAAIPGALSSVSSLPPAAGWMADLFPTPSQDTRSPMCRARPLHPHRHRPSRPGRWSERAGVPAFSPPCKSQSSSVPLSGRGQSHSSGPCCNTTTIHARLEPHGRSSPSLLPLTERVAHRIVRGAECLLLLALVQALVQHERRRDQQWRAEDHTEEAASTDRNLADSTVIKHMHAHAHRRPVGFSLLAMSLSPELVQDEEAVAIIFRISCGYNNSDNLAEHSETL